MKNFYCQFSAFFLCLLTLTQFGYSTSLYSDVKNPLKDRNKVENIPAKDKKEIGGKNDRHKKADIPVNPSKPKKKNVVVLPVVSPSKTGDVKGITTSLALLPMKGIQPIITNLSNQKMAGPDPFRFTITSNKDSIAVGEEIELTVTVDWVDFGVNNGVRFLPEWYKYVLKVVMPKGFLQTGGDYTDYCTKPVDADNPQAAFTIKGKFEYASEDAKFLVLRGFEGANDLSGFIFKGEKEVEFEDKVSSQKGKSSRINVECDITIDQSKIDQRVISVTIPNNYLNRNVSISFGDGTSTVVIPRGYTYTHTYCGTGSKTITYSGFYPSEGCSGTRTTNIIIPTNSLQTKPKKPFSYDELNCTLTLTISPFTLNNEGTLTYRNVSESETNTREIFGYRYVPEAGFYLPNGTTWQVSITTCGIKSDESTWNFRALSNPTSVTATPSSISSGATSELKASCAEGTVKWYNVATAGTSLHSGSPYITNALTANADFYVACESPFCNTERIKITVTIDPCSSTTLDLSATVTDATCGNTDGQIAVTGSGGTSPYQYKKGATETYQTPTAPATNYTFTNLTNGSYTIYVKDNQGCEKSVTKSVGVSDGPSDPTEYAGGSRQGPGSIDLTAKCEDGITETWYKVATGGTAETTTGRTFATGTISVTTDYYVACKSSTCESGRKKVTATILALDCDGNVPNSPSGSNGSRSGEGSVNVYASCTSSKTKWYNASGVLQKTGTDSDDDIFTTPSISSTTKYYASCVKTVGSSECESGTVEVTATINPLGDPCAATTPSKPTKTDGSHEGNGIVSLTASCAGESNTEWYDASSGGNILKTGTNNADDNYTTGYLTATTIYYAACIKDGCKSDRISVSATILSACSTSRPASPSTTGDSREGSGPITVKANCTTAGSTAQWYASSTSTTVLWSGGDYSTTISSTTTFYASCKKGDCETSKVGAMAIVSEISNPCEGNAPATPSVTSGSIEGTGNVNIYGSCNGNLTRWYANSSGGSPLKTANSSTDDLFTTPTISSTTTFYAVCINNSGCESGRVGVAAVILPPCSTRPIAPACTESSREGAGSVTIYASCNNQSGATTRWYDANNNIISNDYALTVTIGSTTSYLASCIKGSCESSRSGVRAIVNPCSTPTPSPTNKAICGPGTITLYANCNNNSLRGRWYNSLTSTEVLRDNDHNNNSVSATISSSRLYYTSCVNPDNNCESPRVGVWAIVLPTTLSTATNAEVCEGIAINLQATNNDSFVFGGFAQPLSKASTYEWRGPNSYVSNIQSPVIPSAQAIHNGIFTSKITNSYTHALLNNGGAVCTATATALVTVHLKPTTVPSFILPSVCRDVSGILTATNCASPNTVLWYNSLTSTVPVGNGTTYPVLIPDNQDNITFYADCSSKPELQCNSPRASQVVSPLPAPPAPISAKANKTNTCIGSSVTLNGSCPAGQTIQWFNADNTVVSVLTFNHTAAGVYKYYAGCQDNATACKTQVANRKEIVVTVNPYPVAPSGASAVATSICVGEPITFNGTCATGQTLRYYSDLGGIVNTIPGTYDYFLGCQDNVSQCATTVADRVKTTVRVSPMPATAVITKQGETTTTSLNLLTSQSIYLEAKGCNDCKTEWYEKIGSTYTLIPDVSTSLFLLKKLTAGTYTYKVRFVNNLCNGGYSNEVTVTVTNCATLAIKEVAPQYACGDGTTLLSVSNTQIGDGINYEWFKQNLNADGTTDIISTNVTGNTYYAQAGKYQVKSCPVSGGYFGESNFLEVSRIDVKAVVAPASLTFVTGTTMNLVGTDFYPVTAGQTLSYLWKEPVASGAVLTNSTLTVPSITKVNQEGEYTFTLTKQIGAKVCKNDATFKTIINPVGCTIDFLATPSFTCDHNLGTITVTPTGTTAGKIVNYRINGGVWQTSNIFENLPQGQYIVEIQESATSLEYGSTTSCFGISGSATVDLNCDLLPVTECSGLKVNASATIREGESLKLSASGCPDGATLIWTDMKTSTTYQNNSIVYPTVNAKFMVNCTVTGTSAAVGGGGKPVGIASPTTTTSCQSTMQVNVVPSSCENFYAGDDIYINKGESVILKSYNCATSGVIYWKNNKDNTTLFSGTPTVKPIESTIYTANCQGSDLTQPACQSKMTIFVNTSNSIDCSISTFKFSASKDVFKTIGEKVILTFSGGGGNGSGIKVIYYQNDQLYQKWIYNEEGQNKTSIEYTLNFATTYRFVYQGNANCERNIIVKYLPNECLNFAVSKKAYIINSGDGVTLTTTKCTGTISWKDITHNLNLSSSIPIVNPTETTTYEATCKIGTVSSETCETVSTTVFLKCSSTELSTTFQNLPDCKYKLTVDGCVGGTKKWQVPSISQELNLYTEGGVTFGSNSRIEGEVRVFCIKPIPTQSCGIITTRKIQCPYDVCNTFRNVFQISSTKLWDESAIIRKTTIYKGLNTPVFIEQAYCKNGEISWKDLKTGVILGTASEVMGDFWKNSPRVSPLVTQDYRMECTFANGDKCSHDFTIEVKDNICDVFKITTSKEIINLGEPVTLTAEFCPATSVKWNTGNTSDDGKSTLTIIPSITTTYIANCDIPAYSIACTQSKTIKVAVKCEDLKLTSKDEAIPLGNSTILTVTGCPSANLTWNTGSSDNGKLTLNITPTKNTIYRATCTSGTSTCFKEITVSVTLSGNDSDCSPFQMIANPISVFPGSGTKITLNYNGELVKTPVTWNYNLGTGSTKLVSPLDNTEYIASSFVIRDEINRVCTNKVIVSVSSCNIAANAQPATTYKSGEKSTLNIFGCSGGAEIYDGTTLIISGVTPFSNFSVYPTKTTNYTIKCINNNTVCTTNVPVYVGTTSIPCDLEISTPKSTMKKGEAVFLSYLNNNAYNDSQVIWSDGEAPSFRSYTATFYPNKTTTYTAAEINRNCVAMKTIFVQPEFDCSFGLGGLNEIKLGEDSYIKAEGCTNGTFKWDWSPKLSGALPTKPTVTTTYMVTCFTENGEKSCQKSFTVNVIPPACQSTFEITADKPISNKAIFIVSGNEVKLNTTGCIGTVNWNNRITSNVGFSPKITDEYTATCSNPVCTKKVKVYVSSPLKITSRNIANSKDQILTVTGCELGTLFWKDNLGTNNPLTVSPSETTIYTAICVSDDGTKTPISIEIGSLCNGFILTAPKSINLSDGVALTTTGCGREVTWKRSNTSGVKNFEVGTDSKNYDTPTQTTTYTAKCITTGCEKTVTVEVLPVLIKNCIDLSVLANPNENGVGFNVYCTNSNTNYGTDITVKGCEIGTITWSQEDIDGKKDLPQFFNKNIISVEPTKYTTYIAKCDYYGKIVTIEQDVRKVSKDCSQTGGGSTGGGNTDPCVDKPATAYAAYGEKLGGFVRNGNKVVLVGNTITLNAVCNGGTVEWEQTTYPFGRYSNGAKIEMTLPSNKTSILYIFYATCNAKDKNGIPCSQRSDDVVIEVLSKDEFAEAIDTFDCKIYEDRPNYYNNTTSVFDYACPTASGIKWYNSANRLLLSGRREYIISNSVKGNRINVTCEYTLRNGSKKTCSDFFTYVDSPRPNSFVNSPSALRVDATARIGEVTGASDCTDQDVSFRKMMKEYVTIFLKEADKNDATTFKTIEVGTGLSNCIVNALNVNTKFLSTYYQGGTISPNINSLALLYQAGGKDWIDNFITELGLSFIEKNIKASKYNTELWPTYDAFKKVSSSCFYINPVSSDDDIKIDNPYSCDVRGKKIDFKGKTVFVGYNGNPVDITNCEKCIPLSFYGADQEGHDGQIESFQIGAKVFVPYRDPKNGNFLYYGFSTAPLHGPNKDLHSLSQVEKYTNPGGTSAVPMYLKTNTFGYYYLTDGNGTETIEVVKQSTSDKVLSECFFNKNENCREYNDYAASKISNIYSQESKRRIFRLYDVEYVTGRYTGLFQSNAGCLNETNPDFNPYFSEYIQNRNTEIARLKTINCDTWTNKDLNLFTKEDFAQLEIECRTKLLIRLENKLLTSELVEQTILELLKSGESSPKLFLESLRDTKIDGKTYLDVFGNGLDDQTVWTGRDNFTKAMQIITELCKKGYDNWYKTNSNDQLGVFDNLQTDNMPLLYDFGWDSESTEQEKYLRASFSAINFFSNSTAPGANITFNYKVDFYKYIPKESCPDSPEGENRCWQHTKEVPLSVAEQRENPNIDKAILIDDPFKPIGIYYHSNIPSFLNEGTGDLKILPAFYLQYLQRKQQAADLVTGIDATLTVASMAIGVGEISAAIKGAQYFKLAIATGDLALDGVNAFILSSGTSIDPELRTKLQVLNIFGTGTVFAVGRIPGINDLLRARRFLRTPQEMLNGVQAVRTNQVLTTPDGTLLRSSDRLQEHTGRVQRFLAKSGYRIADLLTSLEQKFDNISLKLFKNGNVTLKSDQTKVIATLIEDKLIITTNKAKFGDVATGETFTEFNKIVLDDLELPASEFRLGLSGGELICDGKGTFCFTTDTPTETGELMTNKKVGDLISTINPTTGERVMATLKKVKRGFTTQLTSLMIAGTFLNVTPAHALQNEVGEWIPASELHTGDRLRTPTGIVEVQDVCTEQVPATPIVSFELEDDLPYFVGNAKVLVASTCNIRKVLGDLTSEEKTAFFELAKKIKKLGGDHVGLIDKLALGGFTGGQINELKTLMSNMDNIKLKAFADDFKDIGDFIKPSISKRVNAWQKLFINGSTVRKDKDILEATDNFLTNHVNHIAANPGQFEKIIENLVSPVNARCKTCINKGTNAGIPTIDVIIENMDWALTKFKGKNVDIQKLFTEMATQRGLNPYKADGGAFILNVLRTKSDTYLNSITGFEVRYLDGASFEADIRRVEGSTVYLEEYKSYTSGSWYNFTTSKSAVKQLGAYLESGEQFSYFANVTKLDKVANPLEFVQKRFQKIFSDATNATTLFNKNPNLFINNGILNSTVLNQLALQDKLFNHPVLNFIKVL